MGEVAPFRKADGNVGDPNPAPGEAPRPGRFPSCSGCTFDILFMAVVAIIDAIVLSTGGFGAGTWFLVITILGPIVVLVIWFLIRQAIAKRRQRR